MGHRSCKSRSRGYAFPGSCWELPGRLGGEQFPQRFLGRYVPADHHFLVDDEFRRGHYPVRHDAALVGDVVNLGVETQVCDGGAGSGISVI